MPHKKENIRIQRWVLIGGVVLLTFKFIAYFLTQSNAILTDALESIINVVAGVFALYSLIYSARPKDTDHPYGHGKIEFLSAGLEGFLIMIAGTIIIVKSTLAFFSPVAIHHLDYGIGLIIISGAVNYAMGWLLIKRGSRDSSFTMIASGQHLLSDAYSTIGLVIGLVVIYFTKENWIDNVVALIFGGAILSTGYSTVRKSIAGIMDEQDEELGNRVVNVLEERRRPNWIDLHNFRIIQYGAQLHIDCHVTVPFYLTVAEAHDAIKLLEETLQEQSKEPVELFIHTDPCLPPMSCSICVKVDCPYRQAPFQKRIVWDYECVSLNAKHSVS